MMNPVAPTQEAPEATGAMGKMPARALPQFPRNPLGALLIPGLISGGQ
jgi:hypothetical protein